MISFSVVIPVYNRANLIDRTLSSVIKEDLEIIVVDDGSTDGTAECLAKYGDRITVLHQENQGAGAARNLGISKATGDYILFLDSDDLWFPWTLRIFRSVILQLNYPAFVTGKAVEFADISELKIIPPIPLEIESFPNYYASCDQPLWFLGGAVAVKSKVLRKAGGYTSKWINGEDSDLWLKLGTAEHFVVINSPYLLAYYQHPNSAVADRQKTYKGAWHMIKQEQAGLYPGGSYWQKERREILMRHIRPVSLAYLRSGKTKEAWLIYRATWYWNLALKRWIYLVAFWVIFCKAYLANKINKFRLNTKKASINLN